MQRRAVARVERKGREIGMGSRDRKGWELACKKTKGGGGGADRERTECAGSTKVIKFD